MIDANVNLQDFERKLTMNYGPTAKQLEKIGKKLMKNMTIIEIPEPEGWFEDGQRAARNGRKCDYGSCKMKVNQDAYVAGYNSI